jgi:hypothetical protein
MIRKFYDIIMDFGSGGNMSNSDTNDKPSVATKAEQSSTSLPQNPDNWREERAADEYLETVGSHERPDITRHDFLAGYKAAAKPRDEEIERLREERHQLLSDNEKLRHWCASFKQGYEEQTALIQSLEAQNNK